MIFILRSVVHPARLLIGTAGWIREERRRLASGRLDPAYPDAFGSPQRHMLEFVHGVRDSRLRWMRNLECLGMLAGDEPEAATLRESLWYSTREHGRYFPPLYVRAEDLGRWLEHCPDSTPWRVATPESLERLEAAATPWDGSCAEQLGIKGKGKAAPARAGSLAERLAQRRPKG